MFPLFRLVPLVVLLAGAVSAQELNEKAGRYYETLKKRPAPGPVFDRFVDAWLDSGTLEQLETFLSAKVKAEPSATGRMLLGLYYVRQGVHAKAVEQCREALKLEPDNALLWQQKALAESRLLEFDQAIASLEKGLEKKPSEELSLAMRQLLGRQLSRAGRTTDALNVWQKLMADRPDDEALREDVLDLQLAEGLFDAAVENAAALVERAPDAYKKAMRRLQSAEVLDRAGRSDAAMAELEKCLSDSGADSWLEKEVLARLDRIFRRDDNLSGLRAYIDGLVQRQPQRHGLARARVHLLAELGEKSAAVDAGRALLALAPGDRAAREEFIALLVEAGRMEEAVVQTGELVRQTPADRELLLRLASLKFQAGDKAGCLAAVTDYDKLSGADEAARLRSAALLEKAGLISEAITRLQEAAKAFPASTVVSSALASSLHKAKRRDEALTEWKRQAAAAANSVALQEVARALSAYGEDETAWELLSKKSGDGDAPLLTQLCQLAERLDRSADALPHARRLVSLAQSAGDMEAALELAARIIKKSEEADTVITSIGADAGVADLCLLAELLEMRGDSAAAENALNKAALASPDLAAAQLVRLYRMRQAWPQALEAGAKMFAAPGGKKAATAHLLADIAERARDLEVALRWTREWRKLSPGAAPAVLAETRLLRSLGRDEEALKSLRLASGQFEENKEMREELARLCRDTGKTAEALSLYAGLYEQAQEASQKLRTVHEWAEAALEANRITEMLEQFDERRRQNRNATGPLLALAEIHGVNGDREKQRQVLTDATRLRPDDADLALSLAGMQEDDDLMPQAMETLRAALAHDKSGRVRQRLARLHFTAGEQEDGMKLLEDGPGGAPPDAAGVESMAFSLTLSDPDRALGLLAPRIAADPADYRLRFLHAAILAELGQKSEAVREWIALLAIRQESPAVTARRTGSVFSPDADARFKKYAGMVPEDVLHILRVHDLLNQNARQQQWATRYNPSSQTQTSLFQPALPGNVTELRALTAESLLRAAGGNGETAVQAALALVDDGMRELVLLLGRADEDGDPFSQRPGSRNPPQRGRAIENIGGENPLEGKLQPLRTGLYALRYLSGQDESLDRESCRAVWEHWHGSHPDFALAAAIAGLSEAPGEVEWEKSAAEMFLKVEHPHDLVLHGAARYLSQVNSGLGDGTHKAILGRIAAWLESDWITAPGYDDVRHELAAAFIPAGAGYPELEARVLNAEWPREQRAGASPQTIFNARKQRLGNQSNRSRRYLTDGFLSALTWPPAQIPGVSPVFAAQEDGMQIIHRIQPEKAGAIVPLLKHPVLAARMEDYAGRAQHPLPALTKLASAPEAEPAALLLAAVSEAEAERYEEAAKFAAQALERPLPAELRRKLNASIVLWADECLAERGSPLHKAACEAALRLRRDAQFAEQKMELISAMESLGMTAEAGAMKATAMAGGGLQYYNMTYVSGGYSAAVRLQMLMREAKRDLNSGDAGSAVTVAKVLRRQAQFSLSPAGWDGSYNGSVGGANFNGSTEDEVQWPDLLGLIQKKKELAPAVLKALEPGKAAGETRQKAVQAVVHEFYDQADRALELYRETIAAGGTDPGVYVRMVTLLFKTGQREEAEKSFVAAPPEAQEWLIAKFLRRGDREIMETVLRGAAMAQAAAERRDPAITVNFDWLNKVVVLLCEDLDLTGNLRSPRMDGPQDREPVRKPNRPSPSSEDEMAEAKKLMAARRASHEALCRRLLGIPGTAALAFRQLRTMSAPETDFIKEAVTAVVAESKTPAAPPVAAGLTPMQQAYLRSAAAGQDPREGNFNSVSPPVVDVQELMDYILTTSVKRNQPDILRGELVPALQKAGAAKQAEQANLLTDVYFGAPEKVEENARRLTAVGGVKVWPLVVRGLEFRHSTADLSAMVIAEVARARTRPDDLPWAVTAAGDYCLWLCREGRHAQARLLLDRVLDSLTGTARQRSAAFSAMLAADANNRGQPHPIPNTGGVPLFPAAEEATLLLKRLMEAPASVFIALEAVHDGIVPGLSSDLAAEFLPKVRSGLFTNWEFFNNVESVRQFFTGSPLVAEVEKFRSYGGDNGVFFTVAATLYQMQEEDRKKVLEVLRSLPAAFGRDVLIAAASDRWSGEALNTAAVYFDRLRTLPAASQMEIADMLSGLASGRETGSLTDSARTLMNWVAEQRMLMTNTETEKRIEAFLATKMSPGSLSSEYVHSAMEPLLEASVKAMSPRAYDLVRRLSIMVPGNETAETMSWLLSGSHEHEVMPLPADRSAFRLGLLTNAMAAGDKRSPLFVEPLRVALTTTVRWITDESKGSTEDRLTALVNAIAGQVKPGEACVLLEAFPMPVTNDDQPEKRRALCSGAVAWADGPGKSLARQDIVKEIAAAARLELAMENKPRAEGISDEALLPPEQAYYLSVMRDESRGPAARLAVAGILADFAGPWLEPPLLAQAASILERNIVTHRPLADWQRGAIVGALTRGPSSPVSDAAVKSLLARLPLDEDLKTPGSRMEAKHFLALALRADDGSAVARSLAALQASAGDPDALGLVLASGHPVRISNIVRDAETKFYYPVLCGGEVFFDDRVAASLKAALPGITAEALRFRFELSAHCLPSAPGVKTRAERMEEIVVRMTPLLKASSEEARYDLLDLLTCEPAAALSVRRYFDAACHPTIWKEILKQNAKQPSNFKVRFWMVSLFADAAEGNTVALTKRIDLCDNAGEPVDPFATPPGADEEPAYSLAVTVLHGVCGGIAHGWPKWDAAKRAAVQQWLLDRLKNKTLPGAANATEELSRLPRELIEEVNKVLE